MFLKFGVHSQRSAVGPVTLEIDENLIRRDLTPAQRAKLIAKRKAAYEAAHGPAKAVGDRASAAKQGRAGRGRAGASAKLAVVSFTTDTAAKTATNGKVSISSAT